MARIEPGGSVGVPLGFVCRSSRGKLAGIAKATKAQESRPKTKTECFIMDKSAIMKIRRDFIYITAKRKKRDAVKENYIPE